MLWLTCDRWVALAPGRAGLRPSHRRKAHPRRGVCESPTRPWRGGTARDAQSARARSTRPGLESSSSGGRNGCGRVSVISCMCCSYSSRAMRPSRSTNSLPCSLRNSLETRPPRRSRRRASQPKPVVAQIPSYSPCRRVARRFIRRSTRTSCHDRMALDATTCHLSSAPELTATSYPRWSSIVAARAASIHSEKHKWKLWRTADSVLRHVLLSFRTSGQAYTRSR
jgi:hypothetical protein